MATKTKKIQTGKNNILCPECANGTVIFDYNTGDIICTQCGLVISEKILDQGPEWRAYNNLEREKKSRIGSPISKTFPYKGLSTMIDSHDKDIFGNKIKPKKRARLYRMRKWDNRTRLHDSISKNIFKAMLELDKLSSQLEIPKFIKNEAAILYRKALDSKMIKGRNIFGMVTAALYTICRIYNIPLTLSDFYRYSKLNKRKIRKFYSDFIKIMKIKVPPSDPKTFVPRYCADLELSAKVQNKVYEILNALKKMNVISCIGSTKLVAAVIYIAAILEGEKKTQKEIAQVTDICEVTLRDRYKQVAKLLKIKLV